MYAFNSFKPSLPLRMVTKIQEAILAPLAVSQIAREQALWSGKEQKHREEVG